MTETNKICIYCCGQAGSREHLMPRNLGGTLVSTFLCTECNGALGVLDQHLGEESIILLPRLERTTKFRAYASGTHYATFNGMKNVAFRLVNGPSTELLPQIHIFEIGNKNIEIQFLGIEGALTNFIVAVKRQIARNFKDISWEIEPELETLSIINHRGKELLFRVKDELQVERLKQLLSDKLETLSETELVHEKITAPSPVMEGRLKINPPLMERAISKIAFNMMAYVYKPETVLDASFDGARRFIRHGEENDAVHVKILKQDEILIPSANGAEHEVMFFTMTGSTAIVTLYNAVRFLVWFPQGKLPLEAEPISSWTFSGQRDNLFDQNGEQTIADIFKRMGALD
jgi:hypothetical protein